MKKKLSHPKVSHTSATTTLKLIEKIVGFLVILAIFTGPFFFYISQGFAYTPSWTYILVALLTVVVFTYGYFLTLTIPSVGRYVVILILLIAAVALSALYLTIFTPLVNFIIATMTDDLVCTKVPIVAKGLPPIILKNLQAFCTSASYKYFFPY